MPDKIKVEIDSSLEELIPRFLNNMNNNVTLFREALEKGDMETCRSTGHKIKGSGGGYGFNKITEIGKTIEEAAKASDSDSIAKAVDEYEDYLSRIEVVYV